MAFRLKVDEPIEKGFRRAGVEQIERARRQLMATAAGASEVHEARKCMKRIRALLRLARKGLGETVYSEENDSFRAIANSLAGERDHHVLLETIVKLMAETDGSTALALKHLKDAVTATRAPTTADAAAEGYAEANASLERSMKRFKRLRIEPDDFSALEQGLVRNYRKGLERRAIAYAENTDEAFHDWRKCVQAHWRHMTLLSKAWPQLFSAQLEAARELSQILGDDHDLALLRAKMAELPADALPKEDSLEIETLIQVRQNALRSLAKPAGDIIFAESPKAHGRRFAGIWRGAIARLNEENAGVQARTTEPRAKPQVHVRSQ